MDGGLSVDLVNLVNQAPLAVVLLWMLVRTDKRLDDLHNAIDSVAAKVARLCTLVDLLQTLAVDDLRQARDRLTVLEEDRWNS